MAKKVEPEDLSRGMSGEQEEVLAGDPRTGTQARESASTPSVEGEKKLQCRRCGWQGEESQTRSHEGKPACPICSTHRTRPAHDTLKPKEGKKK
jgi:hypothetical protein